MTADTALTGILALLVEQREARIADEESPKKTEVILTEAGLSNEEIAAVTGKKSDAVRMAIQRAKKGRKRG